MENVIADPLLQTGVLGVMLLFFMIKDIKKDAKIVSTLERISLIIDERLPR